MKRTKREKKRKNEKKVNGGGEGVENKGIIDKGQATISRDDPHKFFYKKNKDKEWNLQTKERHAKNKDILFLGK